MGALLLQSLTTGTGVGISCGTCCGSGISVFLSGYLMTHAKNFRQSVKGFLAFYLGKIAAVVFLSIISSCLGRTLMDQDGYIGPVPVKNVVDVLMLLTGAFLLFRWVKEHITGRTGCESCHGHHAGRNERMYIEKLSAGNPQYLLLFGMGSGYGITPCAPLIVILSYCMALPLWGAVLSGTVFTLASGLSPMLLVFLISGGLSGKMHEEMPEILEYFKLLVYILLMAFSAFSLLSGTTLAA